MVQEGSSRKAVICKQIYHSSGIHFPACVKYSALSGEEKKLSCKVIRNTNTFSCPGELKVLNIHFNFCLACLHFGNMLWLKDVSKLGNLCSSNLVWMICFLLMKDDLFPSNQISVAHKSIYKLLTGG